MATASLANGLVCPAPHAASDRVQLGHGSGGKMSAALLRDRFLPLFDNPVLRQLGDGAVVPVPTGEIAVSTDTFVVSPIEFPGGNIGSLAVHGTVNDLAMMGARPRYLSAGFVLEEGLPFDVLDRVVAAMAEAVRSAGIILVTGDTKVVERGRAEGLYVNTTGVGIMDARFRPRPDGVRPGDVLLVSGPIARHGMAIMSAREGIAFEAQIESDSASLVPLVERLREHVGSDVRALRDPTRGGVASALNELAAASGVGVVIEERAVRIPGPVAAACEMLGLDPLYVANEGVLVAFVAPAAAPRALAALRSHPLGAEAEIAGRAVPDHAGLVALRTLAGSTRVVDMLPGDQLPRIC
ncbi:MAG TPA: hydrogenase expression/formation protein HypE [Gemmatimonadaceae bacterium]|nr:hydrogenase expression/formation protein HypE [Gemmatimonadaceae bacterium]